jgi:hypothetical protein
LHVRSDPAPPAGSPGAKPRTRQTRIRSIRRVRRQGSARNTGPATSSGAGPRWDQSCSDSDRRACATFVAICTPSRLSPPACRFWHPEALGRWRDVGIAMAPGHRPHGLDHAPFRMGSCDRINARIEIAFRSEATSLWSAVSDESEVQPSWPRSASKKDAPAMVSPGQRSRELN